MMNPFKEVNWNPDTEDRRTFGRSLMIGFPIIAAVLLLFNLLKTHDVKMWTIWLGAIGFAVGAVCRAIPAIALPFYYVWYTIGCSIGMVSPSRPMVSLSRPKSRAAIRRASISARALLSVDRS